MTEAELRLARIRDLRKELEQYLQAPSITTTLMKVPDFFGGLTRMRDLIADLKHCEWLLEDEAGMMSLHERHMADIE